jgi:hypothetical protein
VKKKDCVLKLTLRTKVVRLEVKKPNPKKDNTMKTIQNSLTGRFTRTPGERFRRSPSETSIHSRGTFLSRSLTGLSMSLLLLLAQFPIAHASTIGYWRMGDGTSLTTDSSGNGLTLTNNGSVIGTAIPGEGNGSAFSNPIPLTDAANTQMAEFDGSNSLSIINPFNNLGSFTAEAFINSQSTSTITQYVMGQWASSAGRRSWALGKAASGGTTVGGVTAGANEMFLILSSDGEAATQAIVPLGLTPELNTDYYVAFSFDGSSSSDDLTFYFQDLTAGGPLTSSVLSSGITTVFNVTATDSSSAFHIGAHASGSRWTGLIDEVRISGSVLEETQLLVIPEPGTLILMGLSGLALWVTRRRRR